MSLEPNVPDTEEVSSIFSTPKSRAEIAAEQKAKKKAEKEKIKAAVKAHKQRVKAEKAAVQAADNGRSTIWVLVGILGVVVLTIGIMLFVQLRGNAHDEAKNSPHFYDQENYPELLDDGINSAITELYYTNNGDLCAQLRLSNGVDDAHYLSSLEVKVYNEDDELIGSGYSADIPADYSVPAKGYNTFTFYISKKFVELHDDDLDQISYEIVAEGEVATDALSTTESATTTVGTSTTSAATTGE